MDRLPVQQKYMAECRQLKRSLRNPQRIQEPSTLLTLSDIILRPSCLSQPHPPFFKLLFINKYNMPDSSTSSEMNLSNKPYSTLLNHITNPLDKNILTNTHALLGLRKVHTDAVARIDFLLSMNTDRLVQ